MKTRLQKTILKIHIFALAIAIANAIFKNFTTYSLEVNAAFAIELLTAISGLTLFFFYINPFRKLSLYFSIYPIVAVLLILAIIFRGLIWALVVHFLLSPIIPDQKEYEQNGIVIYTHGEEFMAPCCSYGIKERKLLLFEKDYGVIESQGAIDFATLKIESTESEIEITWRTESSGEIIKKKIRKQERFFKN